MSFKHTSELPQTVQHVLPMHAQEIYMASFNSAHAEYHLKSKRRDPNESLEDICHKVAWTAVKHTYHKGPTGQWVQGAAHS